MKKFTLTITAIDNAAFGDGVDDFNRDEEIARILADTATRLRNSGAAIVHGNLRDINGNVVGTVSLT